MAQSAADRRKFGFRQCLPIVVALLPALLAGCYAPMHSPGTPATDLPDEFRYPMRTMPQPINFSALTAEQPFAYLLGSGDVLEIAIPDLIGPGQMEAIQVTVLEQGEISLPRVGPIAVGGLSLADAQAQVNRALAADFLQNPRATLRLVQKGTINVLVLGAVKKPGVHGLPRYENDVAHALAAAEGFSEVAGEVVEVHRRDAFPTPGILHPPMTAPTLAPVGNHPALPPVQHVQPVPPPPAPPASIPAPTQLPVLPITRSEPMPLSALQRVTPPQPIQNSVTSLPQPQPPQYPQPQKRVSPYGDYRQAPAAPPRPKIRGQAPVDFPPGYTPVVPEWIPPKPLPAVTQIPCADTAGPILRIPLRGDASWLRPEDVILHPGDVVIVPQKTQEVFYVVGPLSNQNRVRFAVGDRDREIGSGLILPRDREVDVVTAVAMAGYIDPIESPTTVTLHRVGPDGMPMLIIVDLIAARSDPQETLLVQPGDIIYLNPDCAWYSRRLMDRVIDQALGVAIGRWLTN